MVQSILGRFDQAEKTAALNRKEKRVIMPSNKRKREKERL